MKTINAGTQYEVRDVVNLVGENPIRLEKTGETLVFYFADDVTDEAIQSAQSIINIGEGIYAFRGVRVRNNSDVDNVVSDAIKEAIAPGRPANLQGEAEKALLAKISALTAKTALGLTLTAEEQAYLAEKLTFYSNVVQPIRDEGDAFIAAQGW